MEAHTCHGVIVSSFDPRCPACKKKDEAKRVEHPGCGGAFVETRTASSTNGPWTCDKCGAITQTIDATFIGAVRQIEADTDDAWTKVFERFVDEREERDEDGSGSGDRIAVRVMKNGTVNLQVERKLISTDPELSFINHDWSVDPDAGVCTSREGAVQLVDALREALGEEDPKQLAIGLDRFSRIGKGVQEILSKHIASLVDALEECAVDSFHKDCCGVCKHHIVDCDETKVLDDFPNGKESLACAGARARVLLHTITEGRR